MVFFAAGVLALLSFLTGGPLAVILLVLPAAFLYAMGPGLVGAEGHVPYLEVLGVLVVYFCPGVLLLLLGRFLYLANRDRDR
jgi:hypothetical protein